MTTIVFWGLLLVVAYALSLLVARVVIGIVARLVEDEPRGALWRLLRRLLVRPGWGPGVVLLIIAGFSVILAPVAVGIARRMLHVLVEGGRNAG